MPKASIHYYIGIDPGASTGFAVWSTSHSVIVDIDTMTFWETFEIADIYNKMDEVVIVIETPKKTRLYARQDGVDGHRRREKIAANAGGNAREAELLAEGFERLGFTVERVTPTRSKLDAAQFKRITWITHRTNQHERDAVMLVFGR